jgi:DNA/RNA-binding domain of Phe-tRNA-synthetase-like protein
MRIDIEKVVVRDHPDMELVLRVVGDLHVRKSREDLECHKRDLEERVRAEWTAADVKDEPRVAAYRAFYWSLGIDPTKVRPAAEALIRRIARGNPLPTINTAVDAYNVASVETRVAFAAFDVAKLHGDLHMRYAKDAEPFMGIGMDRPKVLAGNELVIDDGEALVAIYPYRDADASKLTMDTRSSVVLGCGVPGLGGGDLLEATERACELLGMYCGPE